VTILTRSKGSSDERNDGLCKRVIPRKNERGWKLKWEMGSKDRRQREGEKGGFHRMKCYNV
jgi:hypothetical protein